MSRYNFSERRQEIFGDVSQHAPSCSYADLLTRWAEPMVSAAEKQGDLMQISYTKLLLFEKLMTIRSHSPKAHAYKMAPGGHVCLWQTMEAFYDRLCIAEIPLTRSLFLPEPTEAVEEDPAEPETRLFMGMTENGQDPLLS